MLLKIIHLVNTDNQYFLQSEFLLDRLTVEDAVMVKFLYPREAAHNPRLTGFGPMPTKIVTEPSSTYAFLFKAFLPRVFVEKMTSECFQRVSLVGFSVTTMAQLECFMF